MQRRTHIADAYPGVAHDRVWADVANGVTTVLLDSRGRFEVLVDRHPPGSEGADRDGEASEGPEPWPGLRGV